MAIVFRNCVIFLLIFGTLSWVSPVVRSEFTRACPEGTACSSWHYCSHQNRASSQPNKASYITCDNDGSPGVCCILRYQSRNRRDGSSTYDSQEADTPAGSPPEKAEYPEAPAQSHAPAPPPEPRPLESYPPAPETKPVHSYLPVSHPKLVPARVQTYATKPTPAPMSPPTPAPVPPPTPSPLPAPKPPKEEYIYNSPSPIPETAHMSYAELIAHTFESFYKDAGREGMDSPPPVVPISPKPPKGYVPPKGVYPPRNQKYQAPRGKQPLPPMQPLPPIQPTPKKPSPYVGPGLKGRAKGDDVTVEESQTPTQTHQQSQEAKHAPTPMRGQMGAQEDRMRGHMDSKEDRMRGQMDSKEDRMRGQMGPKEDGKMLPPPRRMKQHKNPLNNPGPSNFDAASEESKYIYQDLAAGTYGGSSSPKYREPRVQSNSRERQKGSRKSNAGRSYAEHPGDYSEKRSRQRKPVTHHAAADWEPRKYKGPSSDPSDDLNFGRSDSSGRNRKPGKPRGGKSKVPSLSPGQQPGSSYNKMESFSKEPKYSSPETLRREPKYSSPETLRREPKYSSPETLRREPKYSSKEAFRREPKYSPQESLRREPKYSSQEPLRKEPKYSSQEYSKEKGREQNPSTSRGHVENLYGNQRYPSVRVQGSYSGERVPYSGDRKGSSEETKGRSSSERKGPYSDEFKGQSSGDYKSSAERKSSSERKSSYQGGRKPPKQRKSSNRESAYKKPSYQEDKRAGPKSIRPTLSPAELQQSEQRYKQRQQSSQPQPYRPSSSSYSENVATYQQQQLPQNPPTSYQSFSAPIYTTQQQQQQQQQLPQNPPTPYQSFSTPIQASQQQQQQQLPQNQPTPHQSLSTPVYTSQPQQQQLPQNPPTSYQSFSSPPSQPIHNNQEHPAPAPVPAENHHVDHDQLSKLTTSNRHHPDFSKIPTILRNKQAGTSSTASHQSQQRKHQQKRSARGRQYFSRL